MADQSLTQSASLGNQTPKMVDKKPGRLSGLVGFASHKKPGATKLTPVSGKMPGPSSMPKQGGHLRMSGSPNAHRLGSLKPLKLKV